MIDHLAGQLTDQIADQHERLGRAVTAIITEYAASLDSRKVTSGATPQELEKIFDEPFPEQGITIEKILARFTNDVLPHAMQVPSPRYYGQFNPTPLPIGVWADALSSALNQNAGAWRNGPTSAMIEARVLAGIHFRTACSPRRWPPRWAWCSRRATAQPLTPRPIRRPPSSASDALPDAARCLL